MKRQTPTTAERLVESLLNESPSDNTGEWEFCGASGKLSHPDGVLTSWFFWDDDSNSWRPQDVSPEVPTQVADWVVSLDGTRDISKFSNSQQASSRKWQAYDGSNYGESDVVEVQANTGYQTTVVGWNAASGKFKTLRGWIRPEEIKPEYLPELERFKS